MKTVEFKKEEKFDWLEIIKAYCSSQEWAEVKPLNTIASIDMAVKVTRIFDNNGGPADDDVIHYICDAAGKLTFVPGGDIESLEKLKEFKQYFEDLKKSKSIEPVEKADQN